LQWILLIFWVDRIMWIIYKKNPQDWLDNAVDINNENPSWEPGWGKRRWMD
jgi:hypothetical protein